jgi:hypothetical protein
MSDLSYLLLDKYSPKVYIHPAIQESYLTCRLELAFCIIRTV